MTAKAAATVPKDRLPPLGGGLLWFYRLGFALLAAGALAAIVLPLIQPMADPIVIGLRSVKGLALLIVAAILFRRRRRDAVAALLALAFLAWAITSSVDFTSSNLWAQMLDRARFLLLALALLLFPNGDWQPYWTRHAAIASIVVFLLGIVETTGLLSTHLFLPLAIGCILAAVAALIASFRSAGDEVTRKQLKWVALGLVVGIGLILSARAGAALGAGGGMAVLWEILFQSGIVVIAVGFLISLLRYRLFDAESIISRSAVFAVLTAALVATFAGSEALIEMIGQQYLGSGIGQVSAAMAAAIAAVLLAPLHSRVSNWAESRFQAALVELKTKLPELLLDMPLHWPPEVVGATALSRISATVHSTRAALNFEGEVIAQVEAGVLANGTQDRLPVQLPLESLIEGNKGWLLLGPRIDGFSYGSDELDALTEILVPLRRRLVTAANYGLRTECCDHFDQPRLNELK